nr:PREDICTED: monocyte chemotactic protein 1B-like [Paralichthys olivaceus]
MTCLTFLLLVLVTTMVSTASAQGGIASCCRRILNTEVHRDRLKNYYVQQQPSCLLRIVVFKTIKGKRICSDPNNQWTKSSMAYLDEKNGHSQHIT